MTKSSLVFIPGPKSYFFRKDHFADLPKFLEEHGYHVVQMKLPNSSRGKALIQWLDLQKNKKFHFFVNPISAKEFQLLLPENQMASFTVVTEKLPKFSQLNRPKYERFLDRCIELAENEWIESE